MIQVKIKLVFENKRYTISHQMPLDFVCNPENLQLQEMVRQAIKEAGFDKVDEVKITAIFEM